MDEAYTLTPKQALHIQALTNYTDQFGVKQWVLLCELGLIGSLVKTINNFSLTTAPSSNFSMLHTEK